jgi:hypothetical protein
MADVVTPGWENRRHQRSTMLLLEEEDETVLGSSLDDS